jgi:hypothetical protein
MGVGTTQFMGQLMKRFAVESYAYATDGAYLNVPTFSLAGAFNMSFKFFRTDTSNDMFVSSDPAEGTNNAKIGFVGSNLYVRATLNGAAFQTNIGYNDSTMRNKFQTLEVDRDASNVITARLNGGSWVTVGTASGPFRVNRIFLDSAAGNVVVGGMDDVLIKTGAAPQLHLTFNQPTPFTDKSGNGRDATPANISGGATTVQIINH